MKFIIHKILGERVKNLLLILLFVSGPLIASDLITTNESPLSFWDITNKENQMRMSQAKNESILMFGDSITQGLNQNDMHFEYVNLGIAGDTVDGVFRRIKEADISKYRGVFIEIGTNNLLRLQSAGDLSSEIDAVIQYASENAKSVYVNEVFIPNLNKFPTIESNFNAIQHRIHTTCNSYKNCKVIKIPSDIYDSKGIKESMSIEDGVHLNGKAYKIWKKELNKSMAEFPYGLYFRIFK